MKILVPTDFSKQAKVAVDLAAAIARLNDSEVVLHHAHSNLIDWQDLPSGAEARYPEIGTSIERAQQRIDELRTQYPEVRMSTKLSFFETVDELLKDAEKEGINLVIVGTHGRKDRGNQLMGSDSQRMIRLGTCPIIILQEAPRRFPWKNILLATDLNDNLRQSLPLLFELTQVMGAHIHLGYVNSPMTFKNSDETDRLMKNIISNFPKIPITRHTFNHTRIDLGIKLLADQLDADAIALTTQKHSTWSRLFSQSLTETLALDGDRPVISFHV